MKTQVGSHWAFLGAPSQLIVLPRHEPFRLLFAFIAGLVGALVFCSLFLVIDIGWHLSVSAARRGTVLFASLFFYGNIILAALLQATAAGIVAGWVRRLGVLHGLFAAFIGGCLMTVGILGINLLFGNRETAGFIWITSSSVINAGALLALPIALIVSVIAQEIREPHHDLPSQ